MDRKKATNIRRARPDDADTLTGLLRSIAWFHSIEAETEEEAGARVRRHLDLCLADDSHSVYLAEDASAEIAGYVAVHWLPYLFLSGPEGFVSELFVRETARGKGIGSRLLEIVQQEAQTRGCARLSLLNMRGRDSYQRGFYVERGWEERPDAANFVYWLK